jgi:hypothetical protein
MKWDNSYGQSLKRDETALSKVRYFFTKGKLNISVIAFCPEGSMSSKFALK